MNRQQIATAYSLFHERDRVQRRLDTVLSGKGVALAITGDYQDEGVLHSVTEPLADHFRAELAAIDERLILMGWNGE
ncbi:hypothetical protein SJI00_02880 [Pseudomonas sp. RP23018S]|uniref:hypothetical protein n=1 Tax=Pseudomonas sp. RP23018S TaxID=3096037 RepID=UPI002ACA2356|nr:hypothetical protein [Pseudomonas sp. RP23018S]MDZ5601723.1 hypothetical protein [Pseudomonas sp. RP23018S]